MGKNVADTATICNSDSELKVLIDKCSVRCVENRKFCTHQHGKHRPKLFPQILIDSYKCQTLSHTHTNETLFIKCLNYELFVLN
jgi:hypothetical protein